MHLPKNPTVIAIVGHSGSGKTTLIEKLIPALVNAGLKVATIKHSHHQIPLDSPGKDSWRHKRAGAVASMLVTPHAMQLIRDAEEPHDIVELARRYFSDMDLVLAESFSRSNCAKIEVLRRDCATLPRSTIEDGLIALVTDMDEIYPQLPHFALDDIAGIVQFIIAKK